MKKIKLYWRIFVLTVLFSGFIDCSVIIYNKNGENLRLEQEAEPENLQLPQQGRFGRQSGPEAWSSSAAGAPANLVGLADHGAHIDPLQAEMAHQRGSAKEKRCRPRFEPSNAILGTSNDANRNLNIVRRDIPTDIVRRRCETCRNTPRCKNQGMCDLCERICKPLEDLATIDTIDDALNVTQDQALGLSESMRDFKHGDPTMVALANRHLEENGLNEADDRFFTVGSFGPGPTQALLARLLRIEEKSNLDRLIVLAKITSDKKAHTIENPVVIDTAHVFTLNDGRPSPIEMELHPVDADKDVVELTRRLNHDLDKALEHKKHRHSVDGQTDVHLSGMEIDEIIKKALNTGSAKLLDTERVGDANTAAADALDHAEDVGCKKKKKDKDDSDDYYSMQPITFGGAYYREAGSSEEQQGLTDRTVVDNGPTSISSRNGGLENDLDEDVEDSDTIRKTKKGKGGKKHHLTDSDDNLDDVVGAEHHEKEVLHVDQDHKDSPIKSDSHTSDADKGVEHNMHQIKPLSKEDESKESDENDKERHKGKKGKKKGKKHKKGGHDQGYYGGYRDAEGESEEVGDAAARASYEGPMNNQQQAYQQYNQPDQAPSPQMNQQYPPPPQYQPPQQQYHQEESEQHEPPALPNSYHPEEGYESPQDNYQSQENYYDDSSEEGGYDGQDGGEEYQGYEEPQQEEYQDPQYQQSQIPQKQQQYAPPQQQQQQPQYQEEHQPMYQQGPQKAEQQHNPQQIYQPQQQPPQPYPQAQNPVYNHPAPPVEQGTYVPKKPQYNEEPKMLPSAPEEKKQYPISQGHEEEEMPYQEDVNDNEENEYEDRGYEEEDEGYSPQQQEFIIPGLNVGQNGGYDELVGKAQSKDSAPPAKSESQLADQYSKILREDLTQGVKLANKTAEAINKRINKIIEDSKNLSDKERMAQLDEIESAIDKMDDAQDAVVGDGLKQFQARFNKHEEAERDPTVTDPTVGAVLENEHGTFKAVKIPLLDSKHLAKQLADPIIGMANVPSESKVDPKALVHQVEIAKMMRGRNPERVGCKHKEDSSEEYYPRGYYRRENGESRGEELEDGNSEDVGCKKKKKDKESEEEYIMVYPQHGYGAYRENEENSDKKITPTNDCAHEGPHGEDVVGCKKKKKHKDSQEVIYVAPPPQYGGYGAYRETEENADRKFKPTEDAAPQEDDTVGCKKKKKKKDKDSGEEYINVYPAATYNSYGGYYRENEDRSDRRPPNGIVVQPSETLTNEDIEDHVVGLEQPGPSGPFTDEPIDENSEDPTVGCKKKKKDQESHEEYVYYAPKPQYNEYGGYRENQGDADRTKPLEKVKEVIEALVHPANAAKAEKANKSVVQKVSRHREATTEVPKTILPGLIEGIKQLRNHHNQEIEQQAQHPESVPTTTVTEIPKAQHFVPKDFRQSQLIHPPQPQFNSPTNPIPQQNQQFIRPPPNFAPNIRHGPIEDNLAMLEAFHNQQNQQQFFPRVAERVGAAQPFLDDQHHHLNHAHEDVKFGKMIPAQPDRIFGVESREVNEKTQMFFVGDGIKLPIHVKKQQDGTMHLSIDVGKLCKCNNVTCTHAVEGLANLVPTLEKLNHGKVELEVNEDSFNSALHNLNNIEQRDKKKRSPSVVTEDTLNESDDSGELVPVFDDESYDEISPIKKYYHGDLANDLVNLKDNIQKYYENEDQFKEYMSEHQTNKGFFDDFISKRVELLTNVLSWMKSIAIDEARQQQHMDEYSK